MKCKLKNPGLSLSSNLTKFIGIAGRYLFEYDICCHVGLLCMY